MSEETHSQPDLTTENARLRAANAKLRKALVDIAEEQKIYLSHGDYTIEPALTARESQKLAISILLSVAPEKGDA